jgi:amino acid adenylation domain-containing protein
MMLVLEETMSMGNRCPLSHGQEALWFLWKLVPSTWSYNVPLPVAVNGPLDAGAFQRSLQKLFVRHPSLRTAFREQGGKPQQITLDDPAPRIEMVDAARWDDARLGDAIREEVRRPFDLESSAVPRTTLFRRAADRHVLLFVVHHIVSDLWSLIVVMDELRQLYAAETAGRSCTLAPLPVSFETYVREQRERLAGEAGEALWAFWREELAGELPVLDLPTDHSRPPLQSFRGATVVHRMPAILTRAVKELAGKERVTPFMALLAAYQVLLHRYTGQEDLIVGSPTSGRDRAELHGVVGDFVNMVPVRADLSGRPAFRDVLARTRAKLVAAMKHQDYPFSLLVDRIHATRDLSRSPIFQTTFVLQKFHRFPELSRVMLPDGNEAPIPFADLFLEPIALPQQEGQFDVNVEMKEDDQGRLVGAWKYATDLFDRDRIARMARHYETLLGEIVGHPDLPVAELRLLDENERAEALASGCGPSVSQPDATVCELFVAQAAERGAQIAVSCPDEARGSQLAARRSTTTKLASLTYAELSARVDALARRLVTLGVTRDSVVAVLLPRGLEFVTALLAISKAGGAFLPLDVRHPAMRTQQIIDESGAILVLTPERLDELAQVRPSETLPAVDGGDLAYLMFTSGSTGKPKGVMVEHRGMVNHVLAKLSDLGMTASDVLAQNGPPTFDIVVWQCLAPLVNGGRVVVFPDEVAEDPAQLLAAVDEHGVTVLQVVPSMLHAVLDDDVAAPLSTLRWIVPTGEALPAELCLRWLERYPRIPLLNTYGSTECSDDQCHYVLDRLGAADRAVAVASIGTPIRNMTAHVLDSELRPVPGGVAGELYIGGIGVGRGYLRDPERTAASFLPDPFSPRPGARLYRTRDLARRRADGRIDFLGRVDNMIKLRGFRIEPGEIEAALARHPDISAAAVVARQHPAGERVLVAYIVATVPPETAALRRFLAERLPQSMVPAVFCAVDALPLTANGKLDSKRLPAPEWQSVADEELVAPRTNAERLMAGIWCDVLALDRIGVTQDFFAIGGDSIRSIQIVARCKRAGLHISPGDLFQHSTVAALAAFAEPGVADVREVPSFTVAQEQLDLALAQVDFDM